MTLGGFSRQKWWQEGDGDVRLRNCEHQGGAGGNAINAVEVGLGVGGGWHPKGENLEDGAFEHLKNSNRWSLSVDSYARMQCPKKKKKGRPDSYVVFAVQQDHIHIMLVTYLVYLGLTFISESNIYFLVDFICSAHQQANSPGNTEPP